MIKTASTTFTHQLVLRLMQAQWMNERQNHDVFRYGDEKPSLLDGPLGYCRRFIRRLGFYHPAWLNTAQTHILNQWTPLFAELDWFYSVLADDESRKLLVDVVAYRIMGHRAIRLPLSIPKYWKRIAEVEAKANTNDSIALKFLNWKLLRHDLRNVGFPIELYATSAAIIGQFELGQYTCLRGNIFVKPGDVVIDAGGCYGDTSMYFAHKSSPNGRVYSFEFVQENLAVFRRNLAINENLATRIRVVEQAVWNESGVQLTLNEMGPGSSVETVNGQTSKSNSVSTITIDDFVERNHIECVNFIKMDIEGAESAALVGATETIRKFRPELAICLYHRPEDFVTIPRFIAELNLGYEFVIDHYSIHSEETVLFAKATSKSRRVSDP